MILKGGRAATAGLIAGLGVALAAPSLASALSARHGLSPLKGGDDQAAIPVVGAHLTQIGPDLRLSVRLGGGRAGVADGSSVCTQIAVAGTQAQWCFNRRRGHGWRSTVGGKTAGGVETVGQHWIASQLPLQRLGLRAGKTRWSVRSTAADCTAAPDAPCTDELPADPPATGQLWTPVATGCGGTAGRLFHGGPAGKRIAITFDDGPSEYTAQVQAVLRRFGVRATFFMIGNQIAGREANLRAGLAAGHELGNHTWDHPLGATTALNSELARTQAAVRKATGFSPCLFRPPGGELGAGMVAHAGGLGLSTIIWTVDPEDWNTPGTSTIVSRILAQTKPGAIILDHDGGGNRSQTVAALPTVLQKLKARGYEFVTVSELVGNRTTYGLRP